MTSIQKIMEKIKGIRVSNQINLRIIPDDIFLSLILILVAFGSFGLGRLSKIQDSKTPIRIENAIEVSTVPITQKPAPDNQGALVINATTDSAQLVGSKNGTKYYYPWCSGVKNINPENLIHFSSKSEAQARGYTPSSTCKGL